MAPSPRPRATRRLVVACLAAALALALVPARASAFERQHRVGASAGLASLKIDDKPSLSIGASGGLHYTYGLSDQFNVMVEAGYAQVALEERGDRTTPQTRPTGVSHGAVGAGYVLDVLRWVPYVGLSAGAFALTGGTLPETKLVLGGSVALGLDYHLTPSWAVGAALRQHVLVGAASTYPSFTTLTARFEYVWGW